MEVSDRGIGPGTLRETRLAERRPLPALRAGRGLALPRQGPKVPPRPLRVPVLRGPVHGDDQDADARDEAPIEDVAPRLVPRMPARSQGPVALSWREAAAFLRSSAWFI